MRATDLSIIVVNFNAKRFLIECLNSIYNTVGKVSHEIIVVDNRSSDGSLHSVRKMFPDVRLVGNCENVGFARANNQGIRMARGNFILLLNPDAIVTKNAIPHMLDFARKTPTAGIVSCKVINPGGKLQWDSCGRFLTPMTLFLKESGLERLSRRHRFFGRRLMWYWSRNSLEQVDWVSGVCLLIRRKVIEEIGFLDERFFAYMEDMDYCRRARHKQWEVYFLNNCTVLHQLSTTWSRHSERQLSTSLKSEMEYLRKYWPILGSLVFKMFYFLGSYWRFYVNLLAGDRRKTRDHFLVMKWIITHEL